MRVEIACKYQFTIFRGVWPGEIFFILFYGCASEIWFPDTMSRTLSVFDVKYWGRGGTTGPERHENLLYQFIYPPRLSFHTRYSSFSHIRLSNYSIDYLFIKTWIALNYPHRGGALSHEMMLMMWRKKPTSITGISCCEISS